jgi:hypothetical protein
MCIAKLPRFKVLIPVTFDVAKFKLVVLVQAIAGPGKILSDMLIVSSINGIDFPKCQCPLPFFIESVLQARLDITVVEVLLVVDTPSSATANVVGNTFVKIPIVTKANKKFSFSGAKSIAVGTGIPVTVNQQLN